MRSKYILIAVVLVTLGFGMGRLSAAPGTLDSPALPENTQSYSLEDIYNRLDAGAAGAQSTFTEPAAGPGTGTMHTLNEIMDKAPAEDNTSGAVPGEVLSGKTYWGLRTDGTWGTQTGTIPIQTVDNSTVSQAAGYYDAFDLSAVDTDLASGNIRSTVSIYGVAGESNVVNTSSGDAAAGEILSGKKAWVDGAEVTGNIATHTVDNSTVNQAAGYYNAFDLSAVDTDLASGNIRSTVSIYGVSGDTNVVDSSSGTATASEILTDRVAYVDGQEITGTMPNNGAVTIVPTTTNQTVAMGYHNGSGEVLGDADLVTGNIKSGVDIFGVSGDSNVVDTSSGTATASEILTDRVAYVDGQEITGTMPNNGAVTIVPTTTNQTVAMGYHNGSGEVLGDADLVTGNIKSGVDIFGVSGDSNVVDTSSGTATASEILTGTVAYVDGLEVTGTRPAALLARTGQTKCYTTTDESETPCPAADHPGQDGEYQMGVAWPDPRFTDNADGTVTDNLTGLIWLQNANCISGTLSWTGALTFTNSLYDGWTGDPDGGDCGLTDGSDPGDWRLPNVRELFSLIDFSQYEPALPSGHPFTRVESDYYWSSTTYVFLTGNAWLVDLWDGWVFTYVDVGFKDDDYNYVWPVRGGP